jgi:hypothetical protein
VLRNAIIFGLRASAQMTLEGVCTLLQERPDWDTAKRLLGESTFIKRLVEYDKDNVPDKASATGHDCSM